MNVFVLSVVLGLVLAIVTAFLFVSFDKMWLRIVLYLIDLGAGGYVAVFWKSFEITSKEEKILSVTVLYLAFIIFFLVSLCVLCYFIKDKNHPEYLRLRDILLNRQKCLVDYIEWRKAQIDNQYGVEILEAREKLLNEREAELGQRERNVLIEEETNSRVKLQLAKQGKKQLKMVLPVKKNIFIFQEFIDEMPSFFDSYSNCVISINQYIANVVEDLKECSNDTDICITKIKTVFNYLSTVILSNLFGNSSQVRVHFRKYNPENKTFESVKVLEGNGVNPIVGKPLTPIPYEDSMIKKSFECRRAVIKSLNTNATKYDGDNHSVWQDYMTFTFYNIRTNDDMPCLSFGVSVKNREHYRKLFYFLSYARFELYLLSGMDEINDVVRISTLLDRL